MKTLEAIPFKEEKPVFKKLEQIADLASLSKEERRLYDADIRAHRDRLAQLSSAERIGEKRGEIRGEIRGEKRGKKDKQLEIARNMKSRNLDIALIVELTGLSAKEIEKL